MLRFLRVEPPILCLEKMRSRFFTKKRASNKRLGFGSILGKVALAHSVGIINAVLKFNVNQCKFTRLSDDFS